MAELFSKIKEIDEDIKRNIVSLIKSEDLFDDLHDGDDESKRIAQQLESNIKKEIPKDLISRGFHYTTSIEFPFGAENYQHSRYSDGTFACWYGSRDLDTTIYETAFHALKDVMNVEGVTEIIHRERAVYNIRCKGVLVDFVEKVKEYPELIAQDYGFTQQIGKRLSSEGHPGILAPSARMKNGVNVAVFDKKILNDPRIACYLIYQIDPIQQKVRVEKKKGKRYIDIHFADLF